MYQQMEGASVLVEIEEIKPGTKHIDPWNLYPDPSCGESIHNGSYTWEREFISARQLRDMVDMPGYDSAAIMQALKEGPILAKEGNPHTASGSRPDEQYEMWIFYGTCDADDLESAGVHTEDETPKASAMAVILNDKLIKCALNVLDTGEFPYDVLAWQRRPGMPWGMGIARQVRTAQRMLNGSCRAMMDNSGLTAAPQIILGNGVTPADGEWALRGGKMWRAEADVQDVRAAFDAFVVPSVQAEMMNIINFALKIAEDTTGLPAMLQGIKGDAPEGTTSWQDYLNAGAVVPVESVDARVNETSPDDLCDLVFTSGTTGKPKGVMVTHAQTLRVFEVWADVVGLAEGDRYLIVNPFFHTFGYKSGIIASFLKGLTRIWKRT
jgi:hypothetical protein